MNKKHNEGKNDDFDYTCGFSPFKMFIKGHPDWNLPFRGRGKGFDPFIFGFKGGSPFSRANVEKDDEAYSITFEIPGVTKEDIQLEVTPDELWLTAQNDELKKDYQEHLHFRDAVDPSQASANLKAGILTVIAPYTNKIPKTRVKVE